MASWVDFPLEIVEQIVSNVLPAGQSLFVPSLHRSLGKIHILIFIQGPQIPPVPSASEDDSWAHKRVYIPHAKYDDILSLSLTCRQLRNVTDRILYKAVDLVQNCSERDRLGLFLEVISRRPDLVKYNRSAKFSTYHRDEFQGTVGCLNWLNEDLSLKSTGREILDGKTLIKTGASPMGKKRLQDYGTPSKICLLFWLMPDIESVEIFIDILPWVWTQFLMEPLDPPESRARPGHRDWDDGSIGVSKSLKDSRLRELSLVFSDFNPEVRREYSVDRLGNFFMLPHLRKLTFRFAKITGREFHKAIERLSGTSKVTEFSLELGLATSDAAEVLLSLPAALETFTYIYGLFQTVRSKSGEHSFWLDSVPTRSPDDLPGRLDKALYSQRATLKQLHVRGVLIGRRNWGHPVESLREFGRLEEIEITVSLLLSYKEFDIRKHIWKVEDLNLGRLGVKLPVVLKKLKPYVYQTWEVDLIVMELEKMLRDKGTLVPRFDTDLHRVLDS
jgi:hypothetical protein